MAPLLAIPNFSEGRDARTIASIATALTDAHPGVTLLDTHSDPDHNRTVYTLAGPQGALQDALVNGARIATELIDMRTHVGAHPCVGALDVAPIVYIDAAMRGAAAAEALVTADRLGEELGIPVFLYGELTQGARTRAEVRRGGTQALKERIEQGGLTPDFGPKGSLHARAGATLVAARRPLIAFNVELAPPATLETAREIAALIRETGADGLPSVRAIGLTLPHLQDRPQVSTNVEDHTRTNLAQLVAAIARHATPLEAELVGLAPRAAFAGFPDDLPVRNRRYLEDALAS
jgi:glutamate formiminotransferase / 5-formyltetrahydrofolate cyclo-ligase